jgi:hypothetical protein
MSIFENQMSRRYLGEDGYWYLFCVSCGKHRPETEFYNKKGSTFGKTSRCKLHFSKKDKDDDGSMDYMKLSPLTESDFKGARDVLIKLGYTFDSELSIHEQFMLKHGLNEKGK